MRSQLVKTSTLPLYQASHSEHQCLLYSDIDNYKIDKNHIKQIKPKDDLWREACFKLMMAIMTFFLQ